MPQVKEFKMLNTYLDAVKIDSPVKGVKIKQHDSIVLPLKHHTAITTPLPISSSTIIWSLRSKEGRDQLLWPSIN